MPVDLNQERLHLAADAPRRLTALSSDSFDEHTLALPQFCSTHLCEIGSWSSAAGETIMSTGVADSLQSMPAEETSTNVCLLHAQTLPDFASLPGRKKSMFSKPLFLRSISLVLFRLIAFQLSLFYPFKFTEKINANLSPSINSKIDAFQFVACEDIPLCFRKDIVFFKFLNLHWSTFQVSNMLKASASERKRIKHNIFSF